jgi:hypothetical protein
MIPVDETFVPGLLVVRAVPAARAARDWFDALSAHPTGFALAGNLLFSLLGVVWLALVYTRGGGPLSRRAVAAARELATLLRSAFSRDFLASSTWALTDRRRTELAFLLVWLTFFLQYAFRVLYLGEPGFHPLAETYNHLNNVGLVIFALALPRVAPHARSSSVFRAAWIAYAAGGIALLAAVARGWVDAGAAQWMMAFSSAAALAILGSFLVRYVRLLGAGPGFAVGVGALVALYVAVNLLPVAGTGAAQAAFESLAYQLALVMKAALLLGGLHILYVEADRRSLALAERDLLDLEQSDLGLDDDLRALARRVSEVERAADGSAAREAAAALRPALDRLIVRANAAALLGRRRLMLTGSGRAIAAARSQVFLSEAINAALSDLAGETAEPERAFGRVAVEYAPADAAHLRTASSTRLLTACLLTQLRSDAPGAALAVRAQHDGSGRATLAATCRGSFAGRDRDETLREYRRAVSDTSGWIEVDGASSLRCAARVARALGGELAVESCDGGLRLIASFPVTGAPAPAPASFATEPAHA